MAGFAETLGGEPVNAEDAYCLSFRFDNGMLGSMTGGYFLENNKQDDMLIWGREGWLRFDPEPATYLEWFSRRGDGRHTPTRRIAYTGSDLWSGEDQFKHEVFQACLGKGAPPIQVEDGLWMLETAFAAYRAASTGQAQKVKLGV